MYIQYVYTSMHRTEGLDDMYPPCEYTPIPIHARDIAMDEEDYVKYVAQSKKYDS